MESTDASDEKKLHFGDDEGKTKVYDANSDWWYMDDNFLDAPKFRMIADENVSKGKWMVDFKAK